MAPKDDMDLSVVLENESVAERNSGVFDEDEERQALARKETKAVSCLRLFVLALLVSVALTVSILVYKYTTAREQEDFEDAVQDHANKILTAFVANARERVDVIEGFSQDITSHALFAKTPFPNVVLPDFERRGTHIAQLADVTYLHVAMLVTDEERASWENFTVANQGWLQEGLAQQEALSEDRLQQQQENLDNLETSNITQIPPAIYKVKGLGPAPENGPGPYLPYWMMAPAIPVPSLVNFNMFSHPALRDAAKAVVEAERTLASTSLDYSNTTDPNVAGIKWVLDLFIDQSSQGTTRYRDDPGARMLTPIFDTFDLNTRKLVGLINSGVYWRTYLTNILTDSAKGIHVVLENSCHQTFTYVLNGPDCDYLGPGDLHDPAFDDYEHSTGLGAFLGMQDAVDEPVAGECRYGLRVYPSGKTEEQYRTNLPLTFTLSLMAVFVFTSLVFITYDCLVERRQRLVLRAAIQSGTIVSSLFPKQVRDQMYADSQQKEQADSKAESFQRQESRLFQRQESTPAEGPSSLAQLYPDCTVFFADLVGFTKWSASRSPEQVFQLLETIYGSFDAVAKKLRVYKIETIGDCYVAATGLPAAQPDHALRMVKFSSKCLLQMNEQVQNLSDVLGPDTASLSMRVGLNSGPVTAGVLRGERARFQLFGDTVNTASRMESNSEKGRIQVSPSTAELLRQAGKESWLTKRQDLVEAKGKGSMQTYWVTPESPRTIYSESVAETVISREGSDEHDDEFFRTSAC